jgi:hypothetical protein
MTAHAQPLEPEASQCSEDAPLVRDGRWQNPIEGTDAIGGDNDEAIAQIVDVPNFAATVRVTLDVALRQHIAGHESSLRARTTNHSLTYESVSIRQQT